MPINHVEPLKGSFKTHWSVAWAFAISILVSAILHWQSGRWSVVLEPDSMSYMEFDWTSLEGVFRGIRTPGYPAFLAIFENSLGRTAMPVCHWLALVGAVLLWYRGLCDIRFRPWTAAWASIPLLFSRGTWEMGAAIASDSLGISIAIATAGLFLTAMATARSTRSWGSYRAWALLGMATMLAILVRPAYLFLIPLWPVLAVWLSAIVFRRSVRDVALSTTLAIVATIVPFVSYCAVRAATVGEFGLVSFAGYNLIGITGQFLSDDDLPHLSEPARELAARIMQQREQVDGYQRPVDYATMVILYNETVWRIASPAAESLNGPDMVKSNAQLKTLALESLALHRMEYARWLLFNGRSMLDQLLRGALTDIGSKLALIVFASTFGYSLFARHKKTPPSDTVPECSASRGLVMRRYFEMHILFWTVLAFVGAKGLLVILVEPALGRYVSAVGCLIPSAVGWTLGILVEMNNAFSRGGDSST